MAVIASQLIASVATQGVETSKAQLRSVGDTSDSVGSKIGGALGMAAIVGGVALVGLGVASVKMAADFQSGMTTLVTGAGESQKNLGMVSAGILKMSVDTATTTQQLTAGMFMIESAGYHGAAGLTVLQNAAEGAKVGNADLGVVADATTTIMKDYGISAANSAQAINLMIATVASGKTTMQDLAGSLSQILPTASAAHVGLNDVMGAMATMTAEGVPAANAATYLRQTIIGLDAPSSSAAKAMAAVGLSSTQVATELQKSLPGTLQMITDAVGKKFPVGSAAYVEALKAISGGSKTMQGMLDLTGTHLQEFENNVDGVSSSVQQGGKSITGWSLVQQDFNFKIDQAKSAVQALMISIGTALLPVLSNLLNTYVIPLIGRFQDWLNKGGGLKDFQAWIQTASTFLQNQLLPALDALLNQDVIPLAQWVFSLWTDAVNLFQAFQQGQPYAIALGVALATVGSAIALIKIEEFGAGLANTFAELSQGNGIIANLASQALPELGQALGWTTTQAEATSVAIDGIGTASVETEGVVVASAAAETLAMAAVTAGISLLVGATIAAIALALASGQHAMSQATQQANDQLGQTAADTAAKQQAAAAETDVSWKASASDATSRWQSAGEQMARSTADASARGILDAQQLADAFTKAAAQADAAWVQASQDMNLPALYQASGYTNAQIAKILGQNITTDSGTTLSSGQHIQAHASGILNNPVGHMATLAEQGGEWMYIPNPTVGYVPQGASVLPHGMSPSSGGGSGGGIASGSPVIVQLNIGDQQLTRVLMPAMVQAVRNGTGVRY